MTVIAVNADAQNGAIILLLQKIKIFNPEIGAYIEHFSCNEQDIIIKLTNGFFKIKEYLLIEAAKKNSNISPPEIEKIALSYTKMYF